MPLYKVTVEVKETRVVTVQGDSQEDVVHMLSHDTRILDDKYQADTISRKQQVTGVEVKRPVRHTRKD